MAWFQKANGLKKLTVLFLLLLHSVKLGQQACMKYKDMVNYKYKQCLKNRGYFYGAQEVEPHFLKFLFILGAQPPKISALVLLFKLH